MSDSFSIENYEIVNDFLLVSFSDTSESMVSLKSLRERCPCASCMGETDALGNIYKGPKRELGETAYEALNVERIGHYAIRIFWGDRHSDGLYTYEMLRKLGDS